MNLIIITYFAIFTSVQNNKKFVITETIAGQFRYFNLFKKQFMCVSYSLGKLSQK